MSRWKTNETPAPQPKKKPHQSLYMLSGLINILAWLVAVGGVVAGIYWASRTNENSAYGAVGVMMIIGSLVAATFLFWIGYLGKTVAGIARQH